MAVHCLPVSLSTIITQLALGVTRIWWEDPLNYMITRNMGRANVRPPGAASPIGKTI